MKVLFLTIGRMDSLYDRGIYTDLLRNFKKNGHEVYTVSAYEKRRGLKTTLIEEDGAKMLHVSIGNITKCSLIEKGMSTLLIEYQYKSAIEKFFSNVKFDLVLYSTPPITLYSVIKFIKNRDDAKSYLLLKDIFPQNAIDLGLLSEKGVKGIVFKYFRSKEKKLYKISDRIGCMSQANVDYILKYNEYVNREKVEICPNCIEVSDIIITEKEKNRIRNKYGIPKDKQIFIYGGNLGKPQGVLFLIECIKSQKNNLDAFFLIVGDGTEYYKLEAFFKKENPTNMKLIRQLPKSEYEKLVSACDIGMIFLDYRFTIPNFPSRLLSYMQAGLPVLACTDQNTDIGKVIVDGGFGWWCCSNSISEFRGCMNKISQTTVEDMGKQSNLFLKKHFNVDVAYKTIFKE